MSDYQTAIEGMKSILADHEAMVQRFSRAGYKDAFTDYYMGLVPAFDSLENLYVSVIDKETMLSNMAQEVVASAVEITDVAKKREKEVVTINLSLMMAGYVYPAIYKYKGTFAQPLIDQISGKWKEAFPKSNITPAQYEDIEKGFHRKFCYITTAACQMKDMEDDCYELNLLRDYRDTYMSALPDGEELIRQYYDVAPTIVKHINQREDKKAVYEDIWERYIDPCIHMIEDGRKEECLQTYSDMVEALREKYFYLR